MTIIKSIVYANFEEPRSCDRDLGTLNVKKAAILESKIYYFAYSYKFAERGTLKFEHNLGADRNCIHTKFEGAQSRNRDFRDRKSFSKSPPLSPQSRFDPASSSTTISSLLL